MNALLRKKREWEYHNEQTLLRLVKTSADVSVVSVKKAGLITSFLLYIAYKAIEIMLVVVRWMLERPRLKRYTTPEKYAEYVDRDLRNVENKIRNPFFGI